MVIRQSEAMSRGIIGEEQENLLFRLLTIDDADELAVLDSQCFSHPWSKASYENELNNEMAYFFGLFAQDHLIAYGGYWLIFDEGHIANIGVAADFRCQGLGEYLLRRMTIFFLAQKGQKMTLEVRKNNYAAIHLYEKM
ncbi:MAG: GNAT family N-acetyltransferase, partial [Clostridiales bacterium]